MRKKLLFICVSVILSSCLRLDSLLYNPDSSIEEYLFDDFDGLAEIDVDATYSVEDSLIHPFTLQSDPDGDNKTIHNVYVGELAKIATDTVFLYCHGNAGHLDYYWPRIKLLANVGEKNRYGVLAMDYRGYGLSEGPPTEEGLYEDVDACMKWLKENGLTNDRLIIYGFSLGSAPATELCANPRTLAPSKLMLEAPFASDEVMVEDASGLSLPGSFFSDLEINNADEIKKVDKPFFWIHGTADKFLQISTHGETVYENYNGSYSVAHRVEGGAHSDVPTVMGYPEYIDAVETFVKR